MSEHCWASTIFCNLSVPYVSKTRYKEQWEALLFMVPVQLHGVISKSKKSMDHCLCSENKLKSAFKKVKEELFISITKENSSQTSVK